MSIIQSLKSYDPCPDYAAILRPFSRASIAHHVGDVNPIYISNIISGCRKPGKKLEIKLRELAAGIKAEMAEQQEGRADA